MNRDDTIKLANRKIEHEHSRWNTWGIFFFGALISTFTLWGQFKDDIPAYVPFIACAALSLLWVCVALGMRRSTLSWVEVIRKVEEEGSTDFKPNEMFMNSERAHSFCKDLSEFSLFRVTKVLTYMGVVLFFAFVILAIFLFIKTPSKKSQRSIQPRHLSQLVEATNSYAQKSRTVRGAHGRIDART